MPGLEMHDILYQLPILCCWWSIKHLHSFILTSVFHRGLNPVASLCWRHEKGHDLKTQRPERTEGRSSHTSPLCTNSSTNMIQNRPTSNEILGIFPKKISKTQENLFYILPCFIFLNKNTVQLFSAHQGYIHIIKIQ